MPLPAPAPALESGASAKISKLPYQPILSTAPLLRQMCVARVARDFLTQETHSRPEGWEGKGGVWGGGGLESAGG